MSHLAHWAKTGHVDVDLADDLEDGWRYWRRWIEMVAPGSTVELQALDADAGRCLGYVRVVARRREDAALPEPVTSVPAEYVKTPLLPRERPGR